MLLLGHSNSADNLGMRCLGNLFGLVGGGSPAASVRHRTIGSSTDAREVWQSHLPTNQGKNRSPGSGAFLTVFKTKASEPTSYFCSRAIRWLRCRKAPTLENVETT